MKTTHLALLLALAGAPAAALAQQAATTSEPAAGSRLSLGPALGNLKVKDLQASPLMYVANPKGLHLSYEHRSAATRFRAELQATTGRYLAPAVGPREFTFTDEQLNGETTRGTLLLVPTLYQGQLDVSYLRRVNTANPANKWRSYAGLTLHNWLGYADGVAMTTWALNAATLNAAAGGEWSLRPGHLLTLRGAVPLAGVMSRLPYSNVLSYPDDHSYFNLFFRKGTRLATWNQLQRLQLGAGYELALTPRLGLAAAYELEWFHYSQPRSITAFANQGSLRLTYQF
jgi:hypothetical protein